MTVWLWVANNFFVVHSIEPTATRAISSTWIILFHFFFWFLNTFFCMFQEQRWLDLPFRHGPVRRCLLIAININTHIETPLFICEQRTGNLRVHIRSCHQSDAHVLNCVRWCHSTHIVSRPPSPMLRYAMWRVCMMYANPFRTRRNKKKIHLKFE